MQKLIILRGNSGSGKTTVARMLQGKFGPNTMLISSDTVRMEMLHVWGAQGIEKSQPLMIELLKYGKQHSEITKDCITAMGRRGDADGERSAY